MTNFISAIYDYNICTYYLLPLIKLNRRSFGPKNFKQCYINPEGNKIYILVNYRPEAIEFDDNYLALHHIDENNLFLIFNIPDMWAADVQVFIKGTYTKLSLEAKEMIRCFSGLKYKHLAAKSDVPHTDGRLMAIDDDPQQRAYFRERLEHELGLEIDHSIELISIPNQLNYIENLTTAQSQYSV